MNGMIYKQHTAKFLINDSATSWSFSKRKKKKMCWWTFWAGGGTSELHLLAGTSEIFWHYKEYANDNIASTDCVNGWEIGGGVGNVVMVCMRVGGDDDGGTRVFTLSWEP